ncbi:hypothetical protein M8494_16310 [Serratia ureilytica]
MSILPTLLPTQISRWNEGGDVEFSIYHLLTWLSAADVIAFLIASLPRQCRCRHPHALAEDKSSISHYYQAIAYLPRTSGRDHPDNFPYRRSQASCTLPPRGCFLR